MFDRLKWEADRMILDDLVFHLEHQRKSQRDDGGASFAFYKTKALVQQYARFWTARVFRPRNVVELGLWDGGSLAFWFEYFRPEKYVGIDIQRRGDSEYFRRWVASRGLAGRVRTYWGTDQADAAQLTKIVAQEFSGPLDLVIDDASHMYAPTKRSFESLFPKLRPGGLGRSRSRS